MKNTLIVYFTYSGNTERLAKSTHEERIRQNFEADSFTLDEEDMAKIATLDEKQSLFFDHRDPAIVEWFGDLILKHRNQK